MALDDYMNGDYEHALALMRQDPDQHAYYIYIEYISVYGQLGRKQEALDRLERMFGKGWGKKGWIEQLSFAD